MIHLIVISDSTGETGEQIVRAAAAQFNMTSPDIKRYSHVRDLANLKRVLESVDKLEDKIIYYSLVDETLIDFVKKHCDYHNINAVDILTPSIIAIERLTDLTPITQPGALRKMDEKYFERVDAIEFAVRYDDGKDPRGVMNADITIIGVSRTSKTPLSMYLANRNYRVCNIPLVPESPVPDELFQVPARKIVGLTNSPEKLNKIRKERLKALGLPANSSYSEYERIFAELEFSHAVMKRIGCPIFDVSDRAIEETAELIIRHMKKFKS